MKREYHNWYSPNLERNMELLVFGHAGAKILFFPPRMGRFYDYENWHIIDALKDKIQRGDIQVYCLDSIDSETFYSNTQPPKFRISRHGLYEKYILEEVLPWTKDVNSSSNVVVAGCSLGAWHAVNIAMRYPKLFCKVVGMSGRYDLTFSKSYFDDLLAGFRSKKVYENMPIQYLQDLEDDSYLSLINKIEIVIVIGKEDLFFENNLQLKTILEQKNITYQFYEWEGEAHKAHHWREMVQFYL
ncbi:esterase family protein [Wenyingzhuangia sp. IMCC45533]